MTILHFKNLPQVVAFALMMLSLFIILSVMFGGLTMAATCAGCGLGFFYCTFGLSGLVFLVSNI